MTPENVISLEPVMSLGIRINITYIIIHTVYNCVFV